MRPKTASAIISLGLIMTFRMLGLFMILPIFAIAATQLKGATPSLIGFALGIYGLTQCIFQMPFGWLSDKIGRKPIIVFGLAIFALGSLIAAFSDSIYLMIIGRAFQGAGAIGSTILATVSDLTQADSRTKAMAFIGLNIGFAFILAMIIGPALNSFFGLPSIFWLTGALAIIGIFMTLILIPSHKAHFHAEVEAEKKDLPGVIKNLELFRLNFGIFSLHTCLTAAFLVIPILLQHALNLSNQQQVIFYTSILLASFFLAFPFIMLSEKRKKAKFIFLSAIFFFALSILGIVLFPKNTFTLAFLLLIFFTSFTLLEAKLPSFVSKFAPTRKRGTAMGIYSSSQFFGIFAGGSLGGLMLNATSLQWLLSSLIVLIFLWFLLAFGMKNPQLAPGVSA